MKALFILISAAVAGMALGQASGRYVFDFHTKTFSAVAAVKVFQLDGFFASRKSLAISVLTGLSNGSFTAGFDASTQWHIADKTNVLLGLVTRFAPGQTPTFGGLEVGLIYNF